VPPTYAGESREASRRLDVPVRRTARLLQFPARRLATGPIPTTFPETDGGRLVTHEDSRREEEAEAMAKDPVCKMEVDPTKAAGTSEYQGKTYVFCSAGCKRKFDSNPQQYAGK
jgi:YHS domain-containing protein